MYRVVCDTDTTVIAEDAVSIVAVIEKAKANGGEYDEVIDEWACAGCVDSRAESAWESRYSGDPAPVGPAGNPSPIEHYLTQKGEI